MSAYLDTCEACDTCAGCQRRVCWREEPSPGEADGICADCYLTEDPERTNA